VRLLLDAMYAARIAAALVEHGVEAEAIDGDPALLGLSDDGVMERARARGLVVVTENHADFCRIARMSVQTGVGHPGLVLVPAQRREIGWLIRELRRLAAEHPGDDDLRDREIWL
jgi:hypothetical protein